ncbi:MAG TPA: hypothetical protein VD735_03625 [Candidatus Saccharimonadales bacterium]|nr:hypothetical protein [Candidatus Saccharimonadales bacterium]
MTEVTREIVHDKRGASSVLTWLALLVAIVAFIVAVMAYNRSGGNITEDVQDNANSAIDEAQGQ